MSTTGNVGTQAIRYAKYLIQSQAGIEGGGLFTLNMGALVNPPGNTIGATVNGGDDLVLPRGVYQYHINIDSTGTLQRFSSQKWVRVDGAIVDTRGGGDYIRAIDGHNNIGETMSGLINIPNVTGILQIQLQRISGAGVGVVSILATSSVALLKVA